MKINKPTLRLKALINKHLYSERS